VFIVWLSFCGFFFLKFVEKVSKHAKIPNKQANNKKKVYISGVYGLSLFSFTFCFLFRVCFLFAFGVFLFAFGFFVYVCFGFVFRFCVDFGLKKFFLKDMKNKLQRSHTTTVARRMEKKIYRHKQKKQANKQTKQKTPKL